MKPVSQKYPLHCNGFRERPAFHPRRHVPARMEGS
ncbi:protein of unknown function [Rhodovastum atsumiense]|nr:protein of unknown function [Rhodovastum atsumiense]